MKILVIYDSYYGNTEKLAHAIGESMSEKCDVLNVERCSSEELSKINTLIVGSPVHGGKPTAEMREFLSELESNSLIGIKVATFDTRFSPYGHGLGMNILMRVFGFAAEKMAKTLSEKGGFLMIKPEGFIVQHTEGPLEEGELDRAKAWAKEIDKIIHQKGIRFKNVDKSY